MKRLCLLFAFCFCIIARSEEPPLAADVKDIIQLKATVDTPVEWINPYEPTQVTLLEFGQSVVFQGKKPGKYKIGYYTVTMGKLSKPTWFTIVVGGVAPPNGDTPLPVVGGELPFYYLIVDETRDATEARGRMFTDASIQARLRKTGSSLITVDKDVKDTSVDPPVTPPALAPWLNSVKTYPTLIVIDKKGKEVYRGTVPTVQGLIDLISKLGG